MFTINPDAFSSGQIGSKLWLCEELELLYSSIDCLWIYGGWYGLTAFLLKVRGNININEIRSIDIDPDCEPIADMVNEYWKWKSWKFKAVTADCNSIVPVKVDFIINTSTEHFDNFNWFESIPSGTHIALQGADMYHDDHLIHIKNLEEFKKLFPLSTINYEGQKDFNYPTWKFSRFMLIGIK